MTFVKKKHSVRRKKILAVIREQALASSVCSDNQHWFVLFFGMPILGSFFLGREGINLNFDICTTM
jgi:hypothetical protein